MAFDQQAQYGESMFGMEGSDVNGHQKQFKNFGMLHQNIGNELQGGRLNNLNLQA